MQDFVQDFVQDFGLFEREEILHGILQKPPRNSRFFSRFLQDSVQDLLARFLPASPALKTLHHGGRGGGDIVANNRTEAAFSGSD